MPDAPTDSRDEQPLAQDPLQQGRRGYGPRRSDQIARTASDRLGALWRSAGRLEQLTTCVRACLPELLRPHVSVARQDGDELVLLAANASWATRLRLAADDLRADLAELPEFRRVRRVRVQLAQEDAVR